MHLKNFSLIKKNGSYILSPSYDLVSSALVVLDDKEELALTLNAKKKKIKKNDFISFSENFKIENKTIENIFSKYNKITTKWFNLVDKSFLNLELKEKFKNLINDRIERIK